MEAIRERIIAILLEDFTVARGAIGPDSAFNELGIDSLVIAELALLLRNEFGVTIVLGELSETMTISEAAELVANKLAVTR